MERQLSLNLVALDPRRRVAGDEPSNGEPLTLEQMERNVLAMEEAERGQAVKPWLTKPRGEPPSALLRTILQARRAAEARKKRMEDRKHRRRPALP